MSMDFCEGIFVREFWRGFLNDFDLDFDGDCDLMVIVMGFFEWEFDADDRGILMVFLIGFLRVNDVNGHF